MRTINHLLDLARKLYVVFQYGGVTEKTHRAEKEVKTACVIKV